MWFRDLIAVRMSLIKQYLACLEGAEASREAVELYNAPDRWYYFFELTPVIDGNELWSGGNWVAVLLNGRTIAPIKG
ncbi:MAG TPA: hypothetical protein VIN61_05770 [Gammaproteobacteria bacterium]